jgi:Spy/CpxP family protein refolding chaperone
MKRYLCAALAAALLTPGLWAVNARAQDDDAPPPPEQSDRQGGKPDGGKMADQMKKRLELTDEQAAKLKDAMKAHADEMKPFADQVKSLVKKLAGQIKDKASDADVQGSLDALKAARRAMAAAQDKFQDSLEGFLTPTQRAKMAVGMAMRMRQGPGGGRGGPRRRGGPRGGDDDDQGGPKGGDDSDK